MTETDDNTIWMKYTCGGLWMPTMILRWKEVKKNVDGKTFTYETELQQLFINKQGQQKWVPVEYVDYEE
jgi:hypothetical protein